MGDDKHTNGFFAELKRRNVLRVAAGYVVTAWLVIQVAETVMPVYGFSDAAIRTVITGLAVFLPAALLGIVFPYLLKAFEARRGNCVSFTALFIALGRAECRTVQGLYCLAVFLPGNSDDDVFG